MRVVALILVGACAIVLTGCATALASPLPPPPGPGNPGTPIPMPQAVPIAPAPTPPPPVSAPVEIEGAASPAKCYNCVPIALQFATDRQNLMGTERSTLNHLQYGTCTVWLPPGKHYENGALERLIQQIMGNTPDALASVTSVTERTRKQFFAAIRANLAQAPLSSALIYIHGYADSFDEAATRTAILANGLGWTGPKVFYTWPSKGSPFPPDNYTSDEATIEWTEPHLTKFLIDFMTNSHAERIYLIAHSMGTRALSHALVAVVNKSPKLVGHIKQVYLFASDIDAGIYRDQISPILQKAGIHVLVYGSDKDEAIAESSTIHGYPRLGDGPGPQTVFPGITYIDASHVDLSHSLLGEFGHAYLVESTTVVDDLRDWVTDQVDPARKLVQDSGLTYWSLTNEVP